MALSPGIRFGPYEVAGEIGAGGMGVVYRATDTTLEREVAMKVLPQSMASDAERIARFDREAKTLAALNHPNIAQIYGLEKADGTTALVMELVEGPTLADRIEEGALPADEALGIAMQIAEALEGAHSQGIVHRDLKPANIKLRPDGTVKVLDFGIAKALAPDLLTSAPQSPMMTTPATMAGVILGTAAYMSPEQAKGKQIDQRTDIWAFGCLLYEMLTGQMAFGAEDVPTTLARVIDRETDIDSLPASISPAVRQAIKLCLQKDVKKRVRDIGDVRLALEGAFETVSPQAATVAQPLWRRALPAAAALVVGGVLVGLAGELLGPASDSSSATPASSSTAIQRFEFNLGFTAGLGVPGLRAEIEVSPDGSHLVYAGDIAGAGGIQLYTRAIDQFEARLISGIANPRHPFFSPDGEWVAFDSDNGSFLKKVSVRGGPPQTLTGDINRVYGGSWGGDDTIIVSTTDGVDVFRGFLVRVPAAGGMPEVLTTPDPGTAHLFPQALPGGNAVLFTIRETAGLASNGIIAILSLDSLEYQTLIVGGYNARYAATGHIVFVREAALWAVPFDLERLETTGTEVPMVEGVQVNSQRGDAAYAFSDDGLLVYVRGGDLIGAGGARRNLVWVDRDGREELLAAEPLVYFNPRLSPDGQHLAITVQDQVGGSGNQDVSIYDLTRATLSRITFDPAGDQRPVWTPDSQHVVYWSARGEEGGIFRRAANGTGQAERLTTSPVSQLPEAFSPDGTQLVFREFSPQDWDLWILSTEDEPTSQPLLPSEISERFSALSPDGRWIAYVSNETGQNEVYVRPFPNIDDDKRQISRNGGTEPLWGPDGGELFYLGQADDGDDEILMVSVTGEPTFSAGAPEALFAGDYITNNQPSWDISSDGQSFLMMKLPSQTGVSDETSIAFVNNWFEELNRLAPPSP